MAERWEQLGAVVAIGTLGVTVFWNMRQDERIDRQEDEQFASTVYVGEAPQYYYEAHGRPAAGITWVVYNPSPTEIREVWIQGEGTSWVKIGGIQRCTLYSAPENFNAVAVHFKDPEGAWRKQTDGRLDRGYEPMPSNADAGDSIAMDIQGCSG